MQLPALTMAERRGFEPRVACATTDFESVTFGLSDTSPYLFFLAFLFFFLFP